MSRRRSPGVESEDGTLVRIRCSHPGAGGRSRTVTTAKFAPDGDGQWQEVDETDRGQQSVVDRTGRHPAVHILCRSCSIDLRWRLDKLGGALDTIVASGACASAHVPGRHDVELALLVRVATVATR